MCVRQARQIIFDLPQVRYLKKEFAERSFPDVAVELFKREDTFRNYANSLDQTVTHYNKLKNNTKPVEAALIASEVKDIDDQLERAEHALNWNSEGMTDISIVRN